MNSNPMDLSGRRFLVTGASSGIGRATAILISQLGGTVTLTGRNEERLAQTAAALTGEGHVLAPFDLGQLDDIPQWVKSLAVDRGPFAGLVHCAGIHSAQPVQILRARVIEEMMRINVSSAALLARALRQKDCKSAAGCSLVLLSSVAAMVGEATVAAYSASKAAIIGLTRALAVELARDNIRVNAVAPGYVRSEMTDQLRQGLTEDQFSNIAAQHLLGIGRVEDIACAIAFLLADSGGWITGTALVVDGGYTAH